MFGKIKTPIAPKPASGTGKSVLGPRPTEGPPAASGESASATTSDKAKLRPGNDDKIEKYYQLKTRIHRKLVEQLDLGAMNQDDPTLRDQVGELILQLCEKEN